MSTQEPYEGLAGTPGEHRSTGVRAWCLDCREWCYKTYPCRCCTNTTPDALRQKIRDLLRGAAVDDVLISREQLCMWAQAVQDEVGLDDVVAQMRQRCTE